ADTGIRFDYCYSTPKCVPSRVNILTGRYGFRTGQEWGSIPEGEITFGDMLQEAGYATALAGKWQLGLLKENPQHVHENGFEAYCCWAWHEGPRYWAPMIWQNGALLEGIEDRYGPDIYTEFLVQFMKAHKDRPFLAYYPMTLTHFAKTSGVYMEPPGPSGRYQTYEEMVAKADELVGRIVRALDELGVRENTLVLFTGDNGTPNKVLSKLNGRLIRGGKGEHTDAGTHVPLIANWPGTVPAGTVCDDLIDFSDFLPTFADLAGADVLRDRPIDGRSFAPQLRGREGNPRAWVYTEWEGKAWIRDHRWKLYEDGRLYDVPNDQCEEHPLDMSELAGEAQEAYEHLHAALRGLKQGHTPGIM
ncbi:MAG TPA: Cerebroside-sulfatase, partial [Candidatus Hydrogenedentes bacterium]|nr:Cerebroside-sulfatase [Candidatus Hydrogenedentota bacterium]